MNKFICSQLLVVLCLASPFAFGQEEEEFDPKEAIKQIQKDMNEAIDRFAELESASSNNAEGKRVVKNIDKLLKGLRASQDNISKTISDLIKNQKMKSGSGGGSGKGKGKGKGDSQSKDGKGNRKRSQNKKNRNDKPDDKKRDGSSKPKKPGSGDGDEPKDGKPGEDKKGKKKPRQSGKERVPFIDDSQVWGTLPPEQRQLLIGSNFRDYFPDYGKEISDYLKSLNRKK